MNAKPNAPASAANGRDRVRQQGRPLYQKVKGHILDQIRAGGLKPGDQIPSENQLVKQLGASRMTVNRALRELTDEGHLVGVAGVGRFVADHTARGGLLEIRNIADEIVARGHRHEAEPLLLREEQVEGEMAAKLGLAPGSSVFHSLILHREEGVPIQLEDRLVNPKIAPDYLQNDFRRITPHAYLSETAPLQEAEHLVQAIVPPEDVRRRLEMQADDVCLLLQRRTWTRGLTASFARLYHPGSRYVLGGRFKPN